MKVINMTSKLCFEPLALKSIPLSKGALLLWVMLERRFPIKVLGFWTVKHHCSLSSLKVTKKISLGTKNIKLYPYITCNPLSRFHQNISPCTSSWLLKSSLMPYCWKSFKFQDTHWFHTKQSHERFVEASFK